MSAPVPSRDVSRYTDTASLATAPRGLFAMNATYRLFASYKIAADTGVVVRCVFAGDTSGIHRAVDQHPSAKGCNTFGELAASATIGNACTTGGGGTGCSRLAAALVLPLHPAISATDPEAASAA